jgi:hypothetical protein
LPLPPAPNGVGEKKPALGMGARPPGECPRPRFNARGAG